MVAASNIKNDNPVGKVTVMDARQVSRVGQSQGTVGKPGSTAPSASGARHTMDVTCKSLLGMTGCSYVCHHE